MLGYQKNELTQPLCQCKCQCQFQSINHLLITIQITNVNVTQHNMSRTERLKSTNSCPEKMKKKFIYKMIKWEKSNELIDRLKLVREVKSTALDGKLFGPNIDNTLREK